MHIYYVYFYLYACYVCIYFYRYCLIASCIYYEFSDMSLTIDYSFMSKQSYASTYILSYTIPIPILIQLIPMPMPMPLIRMPMPNINSTIFLPSISGMCSISFLWSMIMVFMSLLTCLFSADRAPNSLNTCYLTVCNSDDSECVRVDSTALLSFSYCTFYYRYRIYI